jgi:hypothetical protein
MKIVVSGAIAIVVFDVLASLASRSLGFPYAYATVGSWMIYAVVGYALGRIAPVTIATLGVGAVAFIEATLGWWLSWMIGPGRLKSGTMSATMLLSTLVGVIAIAAVIGAAAGAIGHSRAHVEVSDS